MDIHWRHPFGQGFIDLTHQYAQVQEYFRCKVQSWLEVNAPREMNAPVDRQLAHTSEPTSPRTASPDPYASRTPFCAFASMLEHAIDNLN